MTLPTITITMIAFIGAIIYGAFAITQNTDETLNQ